MLPETRLSPQDFLPHRAPQCFQKTKLSPQDFLSLRLWLQSLDLGTPCGSPGLSRAQDWKLAASEDKGRDHRGNRSIDADTQTWGHGVFSSSFLRRNLSEGKGLLGPEERFGQTRMEPAEEREAL